MKKWTRLSRRRFLWREEEYEAIERERERRREKKLLHVVRYGEAAFITRPGGSGYNKTSQLSSTSGDEETENGSAGLS